MARNLPAKLERRVSYDPIRAGQDGIGPTAVSAAAGGGRRGTRSDRAATFWLRRLVSGAPRAAARGARGAA